MHANLDTLTQSFFDESRNTIFIRGWFIDYEGWPAEQIDICIGDRKIRCYPEVRSDLANAQSNIQVNDLSAGFSTSFTLKHGLKYLKIQAVTRNGKVICFKKQLIRVTNKKKSLSSKARNKHLTNAIRSPSAKTGISPQNNLENKPISIVMPTYNRADGLRLAVDQIYQFCDGSNFEIIVINDGSSDSTEVVLNEFAQDHSNFRFKSIENSGPARARNLGASLAKHEIILFMGDDIIATDAEFIFTHQRLHAQFPSLNFSVLGRVIWPENSFLPVNAVMRHIQGTSGEQFGYSDFCPNSNYDWRFFYTCNVSVKKSIVSDWLVDGFSTDFSAAAFEDGEFAYRMSKKLGDFKVFYAPASVGKHLHHHDVRTFISRQISCGRMAHRLAQKHPELLPALGIASINDAMNRPSERPLGQVSDYTSAIDGIKAWARLLESEQKLGNEPWHRELLFIVFEISYLEGYLSTASNSSSNFENAYAHILAKAKSRLARIVESEVTQNSAMLSAITGIN